MRTLVFLTVVVILSSIDLTAQKLTPPRLVKKVEPACSNEALQARVFEVVRVTLQINKRGEPARLEVMETPGYGLGAKALETVSQWRFDVDPRYFTDERTRIDATADVAFRCQF